MDMIRYYSQTAGQPHIPWNKGRLTGSKPTLQPKHVWAIRARLQMADRKRDLVVRIYRFEPPGTLLMDQLIETLQCFTVDTSPSLLGSKCLG